MRVLEAGLDGETDGHVGYAKPTVEDVAGTTLATGQRTKTVSIDVGQVDIEIPTDRDVTFEPTSGAGINAVSAASMTWCCRCRPRG